MIQKGTGRGTNIFAGLQRFVSPDEMEAKKQTVLEKCSKSNISASMGFAFKEKQDKTVSQDRRARR